VDVSAVGRVDRVDICVSIYPDDTSLVVCSVDSVTTVEATRLNGYAHLRVPEIVPMAKEWSPPRVTGRCPISA
jgi:hypothetical protein